MATIQTSRFGAWLRGVDAFAAHLLLLEREPDVCDAAAAEAALFGDGGDEAGDSDGDEDEQDDTSEPAPAAASL